MTVVLDAAAQAETIDRVRGTLGNAPPNWRTLFEQRFASRNNGFRLRLVSKAPRMNDYFLSLADASRARTAVTATNLAEARNSAVRL